MKVKLEKHYGLLELYQQSSLQEALQLQFLFVMEKFLKPMFNVSGMSVFEVLFCMSSSRIVTSGCFLHSHD